MKLFARFLTVLALASAVSLAAQTINGTVQNGTTNKPAQGDDVVLIKLGQGMEEAGRTKTDAQGKFHFTIGDGGPHLVRVIHQGVTYHTPVPPGTTTADVKVFDVAKKIEGIGVTADVMRFQAQGSQLDGVRLFAVDNHSNPPRTQMNDLNFEFYLPDGAHIESSSAMTEGGQPLNLDPVPQKEKNRYAFIFPLRPGQTMFQVGFTLPYTGSASFDPKSLYPAQHFVVMFPQSMQFAPVAGSKFESRANPREPNSSVQVASNTEVGQPLGFKISGTGVLPERNDDQQQQADSSGPAPRDARPGGGIGEPINAPDPLEKYSWYILGGFGCVLVAGALFVIMRPKPAGAGLPAAAGAEMPSAPVSRPVSVDRTGMLLEALKEELFQLEVEHKQGRISQPEYEKAKAALDETLQRALNRQNKKAT